MNYGGMTNVKMKISEIDQPLSISLIRLDLTEPAHVRHDSDRIIDSLQVNQPILCMALTRWLEQRHI
jgi:hypothetical protein